MITKDMSTVDRKQASRMLGVSIRTVDRYIRLGKLPAYSKSGRILLKKRDIQYHAKGVPVAALEPSIQKMTKIASRQPVALPVHVATISSAKQTDDFYKDLYNEAKKILTEYHQKLEHANYRIGQLESQAVGTGRQGSGFALREIREGDSMASELLKKELLEKEKEIASLKNTLSGEQSARTVFAILTYLLLAAIPAIWYLMKGTL